MRRNDKLTETRLLGTLVLVCYSTAVTAMFVFGYTVLALALAAFGRDFAPLLPPTGM